LQVPWHVLWGPRRVICHLGSGQPACLERAG
jgi:hypothetical protein